VIANIAEGFYRFYFKDSKRFYLIAGGCLGEIKSDIFISFDRGYIKEEIFSDLLQSLEKILKMLNSLIKVTNEHKRKSSYS